MRTYSRRTKIDLVFHPLAAVFQSCNDPGVALFLFQRSAHRPWINDESLKDLLSLTFIGLYSLSPSVKEGVGLVIVDSCSFRRRTLSLSLGIITVPTWYTLKKIIKGNSLNGNMLIIR